MRVFKRKLEVYVRLNGGFTMKSLNFFYIANQDHVFSGCHLSANTCASVQVVKQNDTRDLYIIIVPVSCALSLG